jgi:hypothetical protein
VKMVYIHRFVAASGSGSGSGFDSYASMYKIHV